MKTKTSVTLSVDLLTAIDRAGKGRANRSAFLEEAGWERLEKLARSRRDARDTRILNRAAASLNRQAREALDYQAV